MGSNDKRSIYENLIKKRELFPLLFYLFIHILRSYKSIKDVMIIERKVYVMDNYAFWSSVLDNIFTPLLIVLGGAIVVVFKHYADKFAKIMIAKNEIAEMEKQSTIRKDLLGTIGTMVESAVGSNMQLADSMKEAGAKLTEMQVLELNNTAKQLVLNALPPGLTEEDGVLLEIIGGRDKLNAIIDSMMEKYVYEYKIKSVNQKNKKAEEKPAEEKGDSSHIKMVRIMQTGRLK